MRSTGRRGKRGGASRWLLWPAPVTAGVGRIQAPQRGDINMAVTFGWKGVVDTDLQFSEFYTNDHTVVI